MNRMVRVGLMLIGTAQLVSAVALYRQWPPALAYWPFPGTTPLTFIFVSSIFAAGGASLLWVAATKQTAALAGIGLDYLLVLIPLTIYCFHLARQESDGASYLRYGLANLAGIAFGLLLFLSTFRLPVPAEPPLPRLVRWSFVVFILLLLAVSASLIRQVPDVIPWQITPQLSVVMACMFGGAAGYFAWGLLRPGWVNAGGQLAGFLAYDLVLLVPFLGRLPTVAPEHRTGQHVYLAVIITSGLLAAWYLFIHKPTRFGK